MGDIMPDIEDKPLFCELLTKALVTAGRGRYDHLVDEPVTYLATTNGTDEFVVHGHWAVCVTGDSLTAMGRAVLELVAGSSSRRMPRLTAENVVRARNRSITSRAESRTDIGTSSSVTDGR